MMAASRPPSELLDVLARFRGRLTSKEAAEMRRLVDAYTGTYKRLEPQIIALADEIALMQAEGKAVPIGRIYKLKRWLSLSEQMQHELGDFSGYLRSSLDPLAMEMLKQATLDTKVMLKLFGIAKPVGLAYERLPREAISTLLGFLAPDSPLYKRIGQLAPFSVERVAKTLMDGIALGINPRRVGAMIVSNVTDALGLSLTDAMRMARTAQLWAYREATRANYVANGDVVGAWVWWAELDDRVCMSCVANHGKVFPMDVELDDHYNGRCTQVPIVQGINALAGAPSGEDWFSQQPEAVQSKMMGRGKFEAWQNGQFSFDQLSVERPDETYGRMKFEATLKELIGDQTQ